MRRWIAFVLCLALVLAGCGLKDSENLGDTESTGTIENDADIENAAEAAMKFHTLADPQLLNFVENCVYTELVEDLDSTEYFVENVSTVYISKEYLEELNYNSKANVYFGYTLAELDEQFEGEKYVFTLGEDGQTLVRKFADSKSHYDEVMRNVAVGSGVILVCVTVSILSGAAGASAVSMIFAASAKNGAAFAVSSGVFSAVTAGVVRGFETQSVDEALEAAAAAGSESFKWGAMTGMLLGGAKEAIALKGATLKGLTMNEAAKIQKESKYPLDVIKEFASTEQYEICRAAGLKPQLIDGNMTLIRNIDLNYVDDMGRTNLERMRQGLAALDASGQSYELHHIGQSVDSTLAVLTKAEHMQGGNNKIWHVLGEASQVHGVGNVWNLKRKEIWKGIAEFLS